jgi:hypothetical protein
MVTILFLDNVDYFARMCPGCRKQYPIHHLFMTYHRDCNKINTTEVTRGTDTPYHFGAPEFTPSPSPLFIRVRVTRSFVIYFVFHRSVTILFLDNVDYFAVLIRWMG